MEAILGAGGTAKPGQPLYDLIGEKPKAMLPIGGQPMAQWVLDALAGSSQVERVTIVGLDESHGLTCGDKPLDYLPDVGGLFENIDNALNYLHEKDNTERYAMFISADIPLVKTEMVDWLINQVDPETVKFDLVYTAIPRPVMETRFPTSRRTYVRVADGRFCGGDMSLVSTHLNQGGANTAWPKIIAARKNFYKQVSLVGFWPLLLLMLGRLSIDRGMAIIKQRMNLRARVVQSPYAEMGMDVDRPVQYELACSELESEAV